jgi:hypothetical protein
MTMILGSHLHQSGFTCYGRFKGPRLAHVLSSLVDFVGMDTAGMEATICEYPLPDGRGGVGVTVFQPLVESFVVADSWPDLEDSQGRPIPRAYICLGSCKRYNTEAVSAFLAKELGPVIRQGYFEL